MRGGDAIKLYLPGAEITRRLAGAPVGTPGALPAVVPTLDEPEARPVASVLAALQAKTL